MMSWLPLRRLVASTRAAIACLPNRSIPTRYHSTLKQRPSCSLWTVGALGGAVCVLGYSFTTSARCLGDRQLTLYQYATCPYCCKTRAFLDYHQIPYAIVEVNPLFRREIAFSKYRKVPFITDKDGLQVNDSSLVISLLHSVEVNDKLSMSAALDCYPLVPYTDDKGKEQEERANKYFIMFPDGGSGHMTLAERREEREWREWVDSKLVHTLPPNIYRTLSEALTSFNYISSVGNFNMLERAAAKYVGAVSMFLIAKRLKKKYKLKDDVRESLYDCCDKWTAALGDRRFMGGDKPNLADLAVYGVLNSMDGMGPTFDDMMAHTKIGPWYKEVQLAVNRNKMEFQEKSRPQEQSS